ncbi:MAG TPA: flagellin [Flavobacteriales bacterium]|nr:flagellin [Flavobacteriales bacterium]
MALSILSNAAANKASFSLNKNTANLQQSLTRLSSGKKITTPSDDAGGLAVSMKLSSAIGRNKSVIANIQNALSFAEVQDGALQTSATIVNRMSELKSMSLDVIKSSADVSNYNVEFLALQEQLHSLANEKFNGVSLFATDTASGVFGTGVVNVTIYTSDQGGSGAIVSLSKGLLLSALNFTSATNMANIAGGATGKSLANASGTTKVGVTELSIGFFTKALENIATLRATNAAGMARLQLAEDHARLTKANLEAANSRIMDIDVAEESTRFAKYNILSQASAAMLSQANQSSATALLLL